MRTVATPHVLCDSLPGREGRGKGKRRFAPQGVWRSSSHTEDVEPVVWLAEGVQRPPIPQPQQQTAGRPRRKDEYHLAEVNISQICRTTETLDRQSKATQHPGQLFFMCCSIYS